MDAESKGGAWGEGLLVSDKPDLDVGTFANALLSAAGDEK
jgi:hypothetical protein